TVIPIFLATALLHHNAQFTPSIKGPGMIPCHNSLTESLSKYESVFFLNSSMLLKSTNPFLAHCRSLLIKSIWVYSLLSLMTSHAGFFSLTMDATNFELLNGSSRV